MSADDSPVAASGVVDDDKIENNNERTTAIVTHSLDKTAPDGSASASASTSRPSHPRVHLEESMAYITVSDPVQHTEGIKGKFTMYRVAYDPPPPAADADAASPSTPGATETARPSPLFPYATSVNRRYSDFTWLFDHLHKERPGSIVPPLPEKQQASRFSEAFIEERRLHLELFLRRAARNPELVDTECLLVFLGGGDAEFKKAKRDGVAVAGNNPRSAADAGQNGDDDVVDYGIGNPDGGGGDHHENNTMMDKGKERLIHKKKGIKKWIKERKTNMQGTLVRSPDDAVFEEATRYVSALEAGLKRVEARASAAVKRHGEASSCLLEFGLGCDALSHVDEGARDDDGNFSGGASGTFRAVGEAADALSALCAEHRDREARDFAEPLRDHLRMVGAVKVALVKRNNRRITYTTCLNAVDAKKANLHKYRITPGQEGKAMGVESSLSRAERSVIAARTNYEEVSRRVLREVDRFRRENAAAMHATMAEFARMQKEHADRVAEAWGALVPRVEEADAAETSGISFVDAAAALRDGGSRPGSSPSGGGGGNLAVESATAQVENMAMPSYPPPPEPSANGASNTSNAMESSMLNGAVRYRDPLPEE